jgi:hypothetical protein
MDRSREYASFKRKMLEMVQTFVADNHKKERYAGVAILACILLP